MCVLGGENTCEIAIALAIMIVSKLAISCVYMHY